MPENMASFIQKLNLVKSALEKALGSFTKT